jgi:hypothetical protein
MRKVSVEAEDQGQAVEDLANSRRCELANPLGQPLPIHGRVMYALRDSPRSVAARSTSAAPAP